MAMVSDTGIEPSHCCYPCAGHSDGVALIVHISAPRALCAATGRRSRRCDPHRRDKQLILTRRATRRMCIWSAHRHGVSRHTPLHGVRPVNDRCRFLIESIASVPTSSQLGDAAPCARPAQCSRRQRQRVYNACRTRVNDTVARRGPRIMRTMRPSDHASHDEFVCMEYHRGVSMMSQQCRDQEPFVVLWCMLLYTCTG